MPAVCLPCHRGPNDNVAALAGERRRIYRYQAPTIAVHEVKTGFYSTRLYIVLSDPYPE